MYETSHQSRFNARYGMLGAGALGQPRGMVWGGRWEEGSGWGTHVYLWQIHFDIWKNQYNIVKFKNKIKFKKKRKKKKKEYWTGLPFPTPGDLLDPGIRPVYCVSLLHCRWILYQWATGKPHIDKCTCVLSCFSHISPYGLAACQALLSMGFSRQEYQSRLLCCPPGDLPNPAIKPTSLMSNLHWQVGPLPLCHLKAPYK